VAHGLAGQRLKGERRDETGGVFGQHHMHLGTGHAQAADDFARLVRSDAAGDAKYDVTLSTRTHVGIR
jgi:hypothetical protein